MRNFFMAMVCILSLGYAKSNLQETIEYEYPMRVTVIRKVDKEYKEHVTILYAKSTFNRRPNATSTFAQYDSTVDEALISKVYVECKDTVLTVFTSDMYVDSKSQIDLDYKVKGVYYTPGRHYGFVGDPLIAIPCGYKKRR